MKKLILAAAAVMVVAGSASAADMAVKYRPEVKRCAADWFRGGYIGVNGGGVNYTANRTDSDFFLLGSSSTYVQKKWGYVVGGQIGYNWTTCNTLWGIEIDGDWGRADVTTTAFPNFPGFNLNVNSRFDGLVTGRARTGIVLDSLLLYLTGGVAAVHTRTTWTRAFTPPPSLNQVEFQDWRWGWVAGFGTEWAWSDRVSIRSEVLYVDVADREYSASFAGPAAFGTFRFTNSDSMWISRVGINVKFGDYGGVVAKY